MMRLADTAGRSLVLLLAALALSALGRPAAANNAPEPPKLKSATVEAFDRYVRLTDARNDTELEHGSSPLHVDDLAEPQRTEAHAELKSGQVWIQRLQTRD